MQFVWLAGNLIPWVAFKPDVGNDGTSGQLPFTPGDLRRYFTVIRRKRVDGRPFKAYLRGTMLIQHNLFHTEVEL